MKAVRYLFDRSIYSSEGPKRSIGYSGISYVNLGKGSLHGEYIVLGDNTIGIMEIVNKIGAARYG
jgi:hypothetical protein